MSLTINTNITSLLAQQTLSTTTDSLAQTINRLSTGKSINTAKDNAAGLAIAEGMTAQIRGTKQGARNGNDGISLIQTAESGVNSTLNILQRMRELATQASSGTYAEADLANMDEEYQSLMSEIDRIANTADFNGTPLLSAASTIGVQVGPDNSANNRIDITLFATTTAALGITSNLLTNADAQAGLTLLDDGIKAVTSGLASLGASHSKIESAVAAANDQATYLQAARSRIMDTDFAEESANLAKFQILQQSGAAMLSQANSTGQIALKLLQ